MLDVNLLSVSVFVSNLIQKLPFVDMQSSVVFIAHNKLIINAISPIARHISRPDKIQPMHGLFFFNPVTGILAQYVFAIPIPLLVIHLS